jgi:hypothetical protein
LVVDVVVLEQHMIHKLVVLVEDLLGIAQLELLDQEQLVKGLVEEVKAQLEMAVAVEAVLHRLEQTDLENLEVRVEMEFLLQLLEGLQLLVAAVEEAEQELIKVELQDLEEQAVVEMLVQPH